MNYSVRNIVIAGGLALVAVVAVLLYTSNVRDKAQQNQHRVQVLVAARDIPAGTTGKQVIDQHLLVPKAIVQTDQVPGALTSTQGLDNLVVSQTIYHEQQVPSAIFQPPLTTGTSLQIRANERAISLPIDPNSGLVGTLHDGDHVDVLLAYKGDNGGPSFTRPLLTNVVVLTAPDPKGGASVLLKVSTSTRPSCCTPSSSRRSGSSSARRRRRRTRRPHSRPSRRSCSTGSRRRRPRRPSPE